MYRYCLSNKKREPDSIFGHPNPLGYLDVLFFYLNFFFPLENVLILHQTGCLRRGIAVSAEFCG